MHVLRFFLTSPSVPDATMCSPTPTHSCAHFMETALFAACQLSRLRLPRSFQQYFHHSLPVSDLKSPSQTDIQIPQPTASAADTSGFLLVCLIENASERVPLRCESVLPETFPIKLSDHPEASRYALHH